MVTLIEEWSIRIYNFASFLQRETWSFTQKEEEGRCTVFDKQNPLQSTWTEKP